MKFNGINDDTIRGQRFSQTGAKFAYTDAATITMSGAGSDSKAVVIVKSSTDTLSVVIAADLTCALSTAGAGGLDTGSEAQDTGYYVFFNYEAIWQTRGLTLFSFSHRPNNAERLYLSV